MVVQIYECSVVTLYGQGAFLKTSYNAKTYFPKGRTVKYSGHVPEAPKSTTTTTYLCF
jgi:hypothetical protein